MTFFFFEDGVKHDTYLRRMQSNSTVVENHMHHQRHRTIFRGCGALRWRLGLREVGRSGRTQQYLW